MVWPRGLPVIYTNPALPHITWGGVVCDPAPEDAEEVGVLVPWIGTLHGRDAGQDALSSLAPGVGASEGFGYRMDAPFVMLPDLADDASAVLLGMLCEERLPCETSVERDGNGWQVRCWDRWGDAERFDGETFGEAAALALLGLWGAP